VDVVMYGTEDAAEDAQTEDAEGDAQMRDAAEDAHMVCSLPGL
jgi:hypothetical protein